MTMLTGGQGWLEEEGDADVDDDDDYDDGVDDDDCDDCDDSDDYDDGDDDVNRRSDEGGWRERG